MDKQLPVDETDSSSLGGDSPEYVKAMNLAETPKSFVSLCKSAISLPKLGVSNLRISMTPSKMGPVPDFNQKPTQKRELLDDHEPHSLKVRKKESSSNTSASKQVNERTCVIINKLIEYYLQLKDNG